MNSSKFQGCAAGRHSRTLLIYHNSRLRNASIEENEYNLGFKITERRCSREPAVVITDLSYADDIELISQELYHAQKLLHRVEIEAGKIGLMLNTRKTEVIEYNLQQSPFIKTINGETIKEVSNYKYLGALIASFEKYFEIRKALA